MKKMMNALLVVVMLFIGTAPAYSSGSEILHTFVGGSSDGGNPWGSVILDSGKLYGMTIAGGSSTRGTVFSIGTDGSNHNLVHEFGGGINDGADPSGDLILDSGTLYGLTSAGGDSDNGVLFSMNTDGSSFDLLHEFAGGSDDGQSPHGSLFLDSGTLYGMTYGGGDSDLGTVFSVDTDGNNFTLLHEFAGGNTDGADPYGSVIVDSGKIYGMTNHGGNSNRGTIFSVNTNGSGFSLLHEFAGGISDGRNPFYGSLTLNDAKLYGLTLYGGDSDEGTVFSINTNGSGMTLLHEFAGASGEGIIPYGSLSLYNGRLHGLAAYGGNYNKGAAFSLDTDGGNFDVLHDFAGGTGDGEKPHGSLVHNLGKMYGLTTEGGGSDKGTVFVIHMPGDVSGDGYVGGVDLTTIITNWGMTGATREQGDLSGDGTVSGPDYTEVVTYWGAGVPTEPWSGTPEPATLGLLIVGGLAILRRRLVRRSPKDEDGSR